MWGISLQLSGKSLDRIDKNHKPNPAENYRSSTYTGVQRSDMRSLLTTRIWRV